jgi:hypothetical protein
VAILQDRAIAPVGTAVALLAGLPTLVTANWCPFTVTAANFWREVTQAVGLTLSVVDIQSQTGEQVANVANVSGVPCLVAAPEQKMYGLHVSPAEAKAFLQAAIADNRAD